MTKVFDFKLLDSPSASTEAACVSSPERDYQQSKKSIEDNQSKIAPVLVNDQISAKIGHSLDELALLVYK